MDTSVPKRSKSQHVGLKYKRREQKDYISTLPDAVLSQILSLVPVKQSVRTSILSTRWRYVWALGPTLELTMPSYCSNAKAREFMDLVDHILVLRNGLLIKRLRFCCPRICIYPRVSKLICTALKNGAEDLDLRFNGNVGKVALPFNFLMVSETLTVLRLGKCFGLKVPEEVCLPSLKVLHLVEIIFLHDESLERLFSACPVLEELYIERIVKHDRFDLKTFKLSVPSLKSLTLICKLQANRCNIPNCNYQVMIDAPNLEHLHIYDCMSDQFVVKRSSSLVGASIHVERRCFYSFDEGTYGDGVFELLRTLSAVKTLSLSGFTMMALRYADNIRLPRFRFLKHLTMGITFRKIKPGVDEYGGWRLLPFVLESVPILEDLVFEDGLVPSQRLEGYDDFAVNWVPPDHVPACLRLSLQTIEIHYFATALKEELKLIKYLLENSKVLRRMTISWDSSLDPKIRKKLLKFPRGSSVCQLIFT